MTQKIPIAKPFTRLDSVKEARDFARDVKDMYADRLVDRESAREFLREKGYLTASGRLTARYSR